MRDELHVETITDGIRRGGIRTRLSPRQFIRQLGDEEKNIDTLIFINPMTRMRTDYHNENGKLVYSWRFKYDHDGVQGRAEWL